MSEPEAGTVAWLEQKANELLALHEKECVGRIKQLEAAMHTAGENVMRLTQEAEALRRERDELAAECSSHARGEAMLSEQLTQATGALDKISAIRDSIVGSQQVNWSEHIYPLVAALNEAGFKGAGYDLARENFGTLFDRAKKAEDMVDSLLNAWRDQDWRVLEAAEEQRRRGGE